MVLRNYWWLLIWIFLFGGVSLVFIPKREEIVLGKPCLRWGKLSAALLVIPFILWAAWRTDIYGDTVQYRATFLKMPVGFSQMSAYLATREKGPGFAFLEYVFKTVVSQSDVAFFFFIALIQMLLVARFFRRYSENYWLSLFLFVASTEYLSWVHNGIRQFLAVVIIISCIPLVLQKRYLLMCLVVLCSATIHSSALIFLPFIFIINGKAWNSRTILFILGLILSVVFVERVSGFIVQSMEDTSYQGDIEYYLNDDGTNIFRVLFYSVPTVLSWLFRGSINAREDPFLNMCVNLSIISTGIYVFSFFTSGLLVGALPIYFSLANYILIPWMIKELFNRESALLIEGGFVGVYSVFYYYQVSVTWGLM